MKKIGMALLAGLVALAIFISPMVFSAPDTVYASSDNGSQQMKASVNNLSATSFMNKGNKGDKGHKPSPEQLLGILSRWSGFSVSDIVSVIKKYNLKVPQVINAVVLAKGVDISLNEAAKIVAEGKLKEYVEQNNLQEKFMGALRGLAQYMKGFRDGFRCGANHGHKKIPGIKGRVWKDFVNVLAGWSGIPTETIVSVQRDFRLNPARTINAVVFAKVGNIDLQTSASIVAAGNLQSYLEEQGLTEAFQTARQEVMQLLKQEAQNIKEKLEEKIADALARWSGFDKDKILGLIEEKNIGYATTVVILGKVAGISLDEAKQIVDDGKLISYLKEHNLFEKFKKAKIEIMKLLARIRKP